MPFDSDEQRKAVMANLNGNKGPHSNSISNHDSIHGKSDKKNKMFLENSNKSWKEEPTSKEISLFYDSLSDENRKNYLGSLTDPHRKFSELSDMDKRSLKYWLINLRKNNSHDLFYPDELTVDQLEDDFDGKILLYVDEDEHGDTNSKHQKIIEDPNERVKFAIDFAKKHNAQIYTYVDLDSGDVGFSKGVRYVNRINHGEYVIVKKDGLEVDNS